MPKACRALNSRDTEAMEGGNRRNVKAELQVPLETKPKLLPGEQLGADDSRILPPRSESHECDNTAAALGP